MQMSYRSMERVQSLDARERFNKDNKEELYKLALMATSILLNIYFCP